MLRPIETTDSIALLDLWRRSADYDPMSANLFNEKVWDDPNFDSSLALLAAHSNEVVGFCMGVVRDTGQGVFGYLKLLAIDPDHRRQGLATSLLKEIETQLIQRRCSEIRVAESAPNYLTPGVDRRSTDLRHFLEKHQYKSFGDTVNMSVQLTNHLLLDALEQAGDWELRRHEPTLMPAAVKLLSDNWPSWQAEYQMAANQDPPTALLAMEGENAIGFVAYDANNQGTGWFGPMGTAPEARNKGVGKALLKACLRDMANRGYDSAIIPWVGPVEFYQSQVGAEISRHFVRYSKPLAQA